MPGESTSYFSHSAAHASQISPGRTRARTRRASLYRAFAEAEGDEVDNGLPLRPKPVRIRRPEDSLIRR